MSLRGPFTKKDRKTTKQDTLMLRYGKGDTEDKNPIYRAESTISEL